MKIRFEMEIPYDNTREKDQFISLPNDEKKVLTWIEPYKGKIWRLVINERKNYKEYLNLCRISGNTAVVDTWYNGSIQYYLNKNEILFYNRFGGRRE